MKKIKRINQTVRSVIILAFLFNLQQFNSTVAQGKGELPLRSDIAQELTWNLEDIYKTTAEWENDFQWAEKAIKKYEEFEGKLGNS